MTNFTSILVKVCEKILHSIYEKDTKGVFEPIFGGIGFIIVIFWRMCGRKKFWVWKKV